MLSAVSVVYMSGSGPDCLFGTVGECEEGFLVNENFICLGGSLLVA